MKKLFQYEAFTIYDLGNKIINLHYTTEELTLSEYKEVMKIARDYHKKNGYIYVLITQVEHFNFSSEAWDYVREQAKNTSFITANAIVIKELHQRLLASFYVTITKNVSPTKVFSKKEKGLDWLLQQIQENNTNENRFPLSSII